MITLLLALFVIALIITFAGLFLSMRHPQPPEPTKISYAATRPVTVRQSESMRRGVRLRPPSVEIDYEPPAQRWPAAFASLNVSGLFTHRSGKPAPWVGIVTVLVAVFGIGIFAASTLLPSTGVIVSAYWQPPASTAAPPKAVPAPPTPNVGALLLSNVAGASKALVRVNQLDFAQYANSQEFDTWAYSACSAASMTEVINSYGHNYRITDILKVEAGLHEISPDQGLLEPIGLDRTLAQFGFQTVPLQDKSLNALINIANHGHPVIVNFPPSRWAGGHLLVLRGGDANNVLLADSSRFNMTVMTRSKFEGYWGGAIVVGIPKTA